MAWGDFDKDGFPDLAVAGTTADAALTAIYHNDAGRDFTDIRAKLEPLRSAAVAWADYDNDGDLDLAVAGETAHGPRAILYRNNAGNFIDAQAHLAGAAFSSVAWSDFDKDGRTDLAIAGAGWTRIYRNSPDGFHEIADNLQGIQLGSLAWADFDRDGYLDLAITGEYSTGWSLIGVGRLYRNNAQGAFTDTHVDLPQLSNSSLAWADYDNDGDPDLAITGFSKQGPMAVILRNDGGKFVDIHAGLIRVGGGSLAWGDYDGDGRVDLLLTGSWYDFGQRCTTRLYRNAGNNRFVDTGLRAEGVRYGSLAWADYDQDGDLDFAISGCTCDDRLVTRIYSNDRICRPPMSNSQPAPRATSSRGD